MDGDFAKSLKGKLDPEQYDICVNKGTEPAFTGKYHDSKEQAPIDAFAAIFSFMYIVLVFSLRCVSLIQISPNHTFACLQI